MFIKIDNNLLFVDLDKLNLNRNDNENYAEAEKSVNTALTATVVPKEVMLILNDPKATKPEVF